MSLTPRRRFLDYIQRVPGARSVVSPFLPKPQVVEAALQHLGLVVGNAPIEREIRLAQALDYEPMFMTDLPGILFPWQEDEARSDEEWVVSVIPTSKGEWVRRTRREWNAWGGDDSGFPVQTEQDHEMLVAACQEIEKREDAIRTYYRDWRERVGEEGVIVIGHPHVTWLAYQIGQETSFYHYQDYPETYRRSEEAICQAALYVFGIAMQEGIDFMSESSAGLEFTSPSLFDTQDLPHLRTLSHWTHDHGGLFWYHNCGFTRELILSGRFNRFDADVIETLAPPPEGDNEDLAVSRRHLAESICSKGNLSLILLRDGAVDEVVRATRQMMRDVQGYAHIYSTADAVLEGTPPENLVAFVRTIRETEEG